MSFDRSKWVWMNGRAVRWEDATIHLSTHALHYGTGVFEGMRCYATEDGPAVFRMDAHIERFFASASVYGIEIPYSQIEIEDAISETILRNGFESCYVRPIAYFGSKALGLHARSCPIEVGVLAWPWEVLLGAEGVTSGVRVTVSPWVKFHSSMMPTTAKACGQYLNSILSVHDAHARGFDEALLLDVDGKIAEGPGENLFVVKDGRLRTNDETSSILLGVTRNAVIQIARDLGYEVEIGALHVDDLVAADEAFFTGTAAEVAPIRELDGIAIGSGSRGSITGRIQETFASAVAGRDAKYREWLHFVAAESVSASSGAVSL
jgi:branched-chain amino acid aminotransferase